MYISIQKPLIWGFIISLFLSISMAFASDGPIYLMQDETRLLKIDKDAASVVVANPNYASVMVDTPRHLILIPRAAGSTTFTVLDRNGDVITRERVIIGAEQKPSNSYVKIRRACSNGADGCAPVSVYYCPDGCHEVHVASASQANASGSSGGGQASNAGSGGAPTNLPVALEQ